MALSRNWHPNCFVCAEEGCGEKLEVMEFEGTPEDWHEDHQEEEGASEEKESLRGKAWCMVHFEEVSLLKSLSRLDVTGLRFILMNSYQPCSDLLSNAIIVILRSPRPTISLFTILRFRLSRTVLPLLQPRQLLATITPSISSVPGAEILSSTQ